MIEDLDVHLECRGYQKQDRPPLCVLICISSQNVRPGIFLALHDHSLPTASSLRPTPHVSDPDLPLVSAALFSRRTGQRRR